MYLFFQALLHVEDTKTKLQSSVILDSQVEDVLTRKSNTDALLKNTEELATVIVI